MANVEVKAHRLARSDAITITYRGEGIVRAEVEGDSGTYLTELNPGGSICECVAHTVGHRICSHIRGLHLYEAYGAIWAAERRAKDREARREEPWTDLTNG